MGGCWPHHARWPTVGSGFALTICSRTKTLRIGGVHGLAPGLAAGYRLLTAALGGRGGPTGRLEPAEAGLSLVGGGDGLRRVVRRRSARARLAPSRPAAESWQVGA